MEALIGMMILALIGAFLLPAFQNMFLNNLRSEREVSLLFHSENIVEDLLALYNVESLPLPDLKYHNLNIALLLQELQASKEGDLIHRMMTAHEETFFMDIRVIKKIDSNIHCLSTMNMLNNSEKLELEFMLSAVGR